jgi:hypothetical protein
MLAKSMPCKSSGAQASGCDIFSMIFSFNSNIIAWFREGGFPWCSWPKWYVDQCIISVYLSLSTPCFNKRALQPVMEQLRAGKLRLICRYMAAQTQQEHHNHSSLRPEKMMVALLIPHTSFWELSPNLMTSGRRSRKT